MKKALAIISSIVIFLSTKGIAQTVDSVKTATIKVANLHCNNDMPTIKKQLLNKDGIDEVSFTEIKGDKSVFTVSYHSTIINQDQIENAIESTPGCDDPDSRPYQVKKDSNRKKKK